MSPCYSAGAKGAAEAPEVVPARFGDARAATAFVSTIHGGLPRRGRTDMRRLLKFLHTMGAIGLMGAMACLIVLLSLTPPPDALAGYALMRGAMGAVATWIFLPSLALTLVAGLLAVAFHPGFREAGWAWVKLATGVLVFEGGFVGIQGPMQEEARRSAAALRGEIDPATLTGCARGRAQHALGDPRGRDPQRRPRHLAAAHPAASPFRPVPAGLTHSDCTPEGSCGSAWPGERFQAKPRCRRWGWYPGAPSDVGSMQGAVHRSGGRTTRGRINRQDYQAGRRRSVMATRGFTGRPPAAAIRERLPPGQYLTGRLPRAPARADASGLDRGLALHPAPGVAASGELDLGRVRTAAAHPLERRHPLRDQVVEIRHRLGGRQLRRPSRGGRP
jgi:hypothetical protein